MKIASIIFAFIGSVLLVYVGLGLYQHIKAVDDNALAKTFAALPGVDIESKRKAAYAIIISGALGTIGTILLFVKASKLKYVSIGLFIAGIAITGIYDKTSLVITISTLGIASILALLTKNKNTELENA